MFDLLTVKPLSDILIIERIPNETQTQWGLIFPEIAQERPDIGIVVAMGPGKLLPKQKCRHCNQDSHAVILPMSVKHGDKVMFSKYANLPFKYQDKEYITMHEADIIGIMEERHAAKEVRK